MKNDIFKKISIKSKSKNTKNEKVNSNQKKLNIPKLKINIINTNKNQLQEKEKIFQKTITNLPIYNKKEKKLITNNHHNNNSKIVNNTMEKENSSNTDRTIKKDINLNKTMLNFLTINNNRINEKITPFRPLLLSPINRTKKTINNNKSKNKINEIENSLMDKTYESNMLTLVKHKSSQDFRKNIKFSKIHLSKNNKNNLNENKNSRKKTLDKNKSINPIDNYNYLSNSNKSFYKFNKNFSIDSSSNNISRNENMNKVNLKTYNLNKLDVIFENNIKNKESHHYLENTISAKNKIVKKRNTKELSSNELEKKNKKVNNKLLVKKLNTIFDKEYQNEKLRNTLNKTNTNFNNNKKLLESTNINNINNIVKTIKLLKRTKSIDFKSNNLGNIITSTPINLEIPKIFNKRIDDYLITKELGKGSCAVVKLATHKITKDKFAIKIYTKEFLLDPQKRKVVKNEINTLKQLDNEFIMKLYEEIDTPDYLYLVLEYINGTPLIDILKNEKNGFLPEKRAIKLMSQIIKGIIYLHSKNICHRDIKLENILVLKNDAIKIIDFGFAVKCNKDSYQKLFCGTPSYMAPEILNKEKYIPYYCDVWSLGVLFYTMIYGRFPFEYDDKMFNEEYEGEVEKIVDIKVDFSDVIKVDERIIKLFKRIFVCDPKERIKINEILDILLCN